MQIQPIVNNGINGQLASETKPKKRHVDLSLYALPVAACISRGILTKGRLGTRAMATAKTGAGWGVALLALGALSSVKNVIISKSEKLQKLVAENPLASLIVDLGLFMGALTLGGKGLKQLGAKLASKNPKMLTSLFTHMQNTKRIINNTSLNKKVLPSILKGIDKVDTIAPGVVSVGKTVVRNSVLLTFLAGIMHGAHRGAKQ